MSAREMHRLRRAARRRPRGIGAVLLMVVVASALVTTLLANWGVRLLRLRQQLGQEQLRIQLDLLGDAALRRGVHRASIDGSYRGETWSIPAADLPQTAGAAVKIDVLGHDSAANAAAIQLEILSGEGGAPLRASRRWTLAAPAAESNRIQ